MRDLPLPSFGKKYAGSPLTGDIPLYKAIVAYRQKEYGQALALAQAPGILNSGMQAKVIAMSHLHLHNYGEARKLVCVSSSDSTATLLCNKLKADDELRFKSKFQAAALSAFIPGSGKIYSGRIADGLYSLLLVGLTAWQSYDGFEDDGASSAKGWIFGVLGTAFYLGNIYGSAVAVEIYNRKIHNEFLRGLQIEITLP
jgi:TM2 domain-containing membrane protein YozV